MNQVFEQCSIGPLILKNRILRAATHEGMAKEEALKIVRLLLGVTANTLRCYYGRIPASMMNK
jgi:2,4-dienoyl-CoA reductase-like NADH-dependent reductase (Old Yellow Enzyme family)